MDITSPLGGTQTEFCLGCQRFLKKLFYCSLCKCFFCENCWPQNMTHRPGAAVQVLHEKVPLDLYRRLRSAFDPSHDASTQHQLHRDDMETKWFAVLRKDDTTSRTFYDTGRYASLIASASQGKPMERYPSLVSFVGQTGAGKSTLVKILIERQVLFMDQSMHIGPVQETFRTPVVGTAVNNTEPTSGDVHLYPDPTSYYEETPLFFVDSEGLEGGERLPVASRQTAEGDIETATSAAPVPFGTPGVRQRKRSRSRAKITKNWRFSREVKRDIHWADTPARERREFAVAHFYPRILYSFSDVIVFVLRNPRTFESAVVSKLVDWAAEVLNCATNQPRLPHAIIVLNACDQRTNRKQWDPNLATETLLGSVSNTAPSSEEAERLKRLMKHWNMKEKPVQNLRDLLLCYYSSVRVVCIPTNEEYCLVDQQIGRLYGEIQSACAQSHRAKRDARMRLNADELDELFQKAFDHFSNSLDSPFDMVEAARRNMPIPRDFAGNVTKLALSIGEVQDLTGQVSLTTIFQHLAYLVASCIVLDCRRNRWKGSVMEFFDRNYRQACVAALEDFFNQFWPCEFEFPNGRGRCVNTNERHQKGHQLNAKYPVLNRHCPGAFQSQTRLPELRQKWVQWICESINRNEANLRRGPVSPLIEDIMVNSHHRDIIRYFYEAVGGSLKYLSHSICLCCLGELPEHPLPCGHVLCTSCFRAYAELESQTGSKSAPASILKGELRLSQCPLHVEGRMSFRFKEPRVVNIKPRGAGVRILCLDGGGVRGIVELEVLEQIERYLGGNIPIQAFFDLIVGTSTGGLIAAGLGVMNWRVDDCIDHFLSLADKAFTKRPIGFQTIPLIGRIGRKYKTKPFEEALRDAFGESALFGGELSEQSSYNTKVALTSTSGTGAAALILSNYNRPDGTDFVDFVRPDHPSAELKIWEALRATTAAPGYFSCYKKPETGQKFVDGALYYNNPVYVAWAESKLLWPDVRHREPDIILSIGTGHNGRNTHGGKRKSLTRYPSLSARPPESYSAHSRADGKSPLSSEGAFHLDVEATQNLKVIFTLMANVLNSHQAWVGFTKERLLQVSPHSVPDVERRFQRIDPNLGFEPPALDKKEKIPELRVAVGRLLSVDWRYRDKIQHISRQLIASTFYFETDRHHSAGSGRFEFHGRIQCRFPNNSMELSHLGEFLRTDQGQTRAGMHRRRSYPLFRVLEPGRPTVEVELTRHHLDMMAMGDRSFLNLDPVSYTVSSRKAAVVMSMVFCDAGDGGTHKLDVIPISGFPRELVADASPASLVQDAQPKTPVIDLQDVWGDLSLGPDGFPSSSNWEPPNFGDNQDARFASSSGQARQGTVGSSSGASSASSWVNDWEERRLRRRRGIPDLEVLIQEGMSSVDALTSPYFPPIPESPMRAAPAAETAVYEQPSLVPSQTFEFGIPRTLPAELEGSAVVISETPRGTANPELGEYRENLDVDREELDMAVEETMKAAPNIIWSRFQSGPRSSRQRALAEALVSRGYQPPGVSEEPE